MTHGLSCSRACGIFLDQAGNEPVSPTLAGRFFTTEPPGRPQIGSHPKVLVNMNLGGHYILQMVMLCHRIFM